MLNCPLLKNRRRGVVVPLTALMLIVIMAFLALAIDLGWIIVVRSELQNAADAAALAGASQLLDPSLLKGSNTWQTVTPTILTKARTQSQTYGAANKGGGISLTLDSNTSNATTGDVFCGRLENPSNRSEQVSTANYPYNAVQIQVHRDNVRNGALGLFFARALGINNRNLTATATALYAGNITGVKIRTPGTTTVKLLPYALDVRTWDNAPGRPWYTSTMPPGVLQGTGQDLFSRNTTTHAVSSGSDGIPECKLFPLSNGGQGQQTSGLPPGNFGTVDIGSSNNSTADLARQITYGPNTTDLAFFPNGELKLQTTGSRYDASVPYPNIILNGDTGVSAGVKDELAAIIGQPRIIPLYVRVAGPGNNANYTIVAFAGITITEVVLTGSLSKKHITIQPCHVIDGNTIGGGSSSTSFYVSKPLALCR